MINTPSNLSKNAIIYCRVSTKEQVDEGTSLAMQEKLCTEYALKNEYKIAEIFIEQGESAKTTDRTELQRLLRYCSSSKERINAIIVYKIDRISRNTDDYSYLRIALKKHGVEIKSASEHFENTPAGRFMENIIANVAQFDNDVRTERSIGGMKEAVREGRYVWTAPLGYDNIRINGRSTIAQNKQSKVVLKTYQMVAQNVATIEDVRKEIMQIGLVNRLGKPISKSQFYAMLKNKLYTGVIIKFGEQHKGLFDPIVSEQLFEQVQYVLKKRTQRTGKYVIESSDFPLRRFIYHPSGFRLTGSWCKGRNKHYPYYRFPIKGMWYKKESLENLFMSYMDALKLTNTQYSELKQAVKRHFLKGTENHEKEITKARAYFLELRSNQTNLIQKNMQGVISDNILREQLELIEKELFNVNKVLMTDSIERKEIEGMFDFVCNYFKNPSKIWVNSSLEDRLKLQWFHFPKGINFDGEKFGTREPLFIFKANKPPLAQNSYTVPSVVASKNNPEITHEEYWNQFSSKIKELSDILKSNKDYVP